MGGVRGVVGGHRVDHPLGQRRRQGFYIGAGAQRRVHLERRVQGGGVPVGEPEMVGGGLGGYGNAAFLGSADQIDGAGAAHVLDVVGRPGQLGQGQIPGRRRRLGQGGDARHPEQGGLLPLVHVAAPAQPRILGVLRDHPSPPRQVLHGPAQQPGVLDRFSVVGEHPDPGRQQLVEAGQADAFHAGGDAPGGDDFDEARPPAPIRYVTGQMPGVGGGVGVGHGHHRRVSAGRGGRRAGGDVLLPFLAGFAQMGVEIDEAGAEQQSGEVDHPVGVRGPGASLPACPPLRDRGDRRHLAAGQQHVGVHLAVRSKDSGAPEQEGPPLRGAHSRPPSRRNSTAIRTATPLAAWSSTRHRGWPATASSISTPRFIGPGWSTTARGGSRSKRRRVMP